MLVLATESAAPPAGPDAPGRAARLGDELRRLPHGHARTASGSPAAWRLASSAAASRPTRSTTTTPTARARPSTTSVETAGDQGRLRRARPAAARQLDQGGARPQPGRRLGHRGGRLRAGAPRAGHPAHDQLSPRPRARPRLRARRGPPRAGSRPCMSASFGFGGTNNALVFRRWTR